MKMQFSNDTFLRVTDPRYRKNEDGSATLIFTILLSIMLILVTAEMRSLSQLHQEERFLEKQQMKRLDQSQVPTNTVATVVIISNSSSFQ